MFAASSRLSQIQACLTSNQSLRPANQVIILIISKANYSGSHWPSSSAGSDRAQPQSGISVLSQVIGKLKEKLLQRKYLAKQEPASRYC